MKAKKEILDFELAVDPRPLTKEDILAISEYIRNDKRMKMSIPKGYGRKASAKLSRKQQANEITERIV